MPSKLNLSIYLLNRLHNTKIGNKTSESVEQFKYLRTILTNQNRIHEETKEETELMEFLLSVDAESFVFQFTTPKYKDYTEL
jgi:hypothetical protein